jgi:hypothetical protein
MTAEQLQKANVLQVKIDLINQLEADAEQYRKQRFTGALPTSVTRYLSDKPELMLEVIDFISEKAIQDRNKLQSELSEL